jgi:sugar (pentulose or hexulose) kinase
MTGRLVISIDSSTTACKAIAWDATGRAVAEGRSTYPMLQPQVAWHEQRAEDWWNGACRALRNCISQIDVHSVDAFAITHQRESFVPVDNEGEPIRNAILWSDERSRTEVLALERRFGRDALHRLTGKPPSMTASISKILWLVENEPETVARTYKFLEVHAYLVWRLTGTYRTGLANADPMGLLDIQNRCWATDLIEALGLRESQFPELVEPGSKIGVVSVDAAQQCGLPAGLPIIAGAGDGHCAGLGANATGGGRAYLNLGTAIASGAMSREYLCDRAFRTLYAPIPDHYFIEHILRGGVFTVAWFVDKFASDLCKLALPLSPEEVLEAAAAKLPSGAQGLMLVPYWNNVMSPYWDPLASGITIGWTGAHGREHLYRAILEGIAFEQRLVGDAMMAAAGERYSEYITMGGGSRSRLWRQILADVTGVPVVSSTTTEATCLGAGILAAFGAGWYSDVRSAAEAMTSTGERFEPNPELRRVYDRLYTEVYQPLFPAVQPFLDRLTVLTHGMDQGNDS